MTTETKGEPLIVTNEVSKVFPLPEGHGDFTVLEEISVEVKPGEILALLGRSGSGKSTLLRILAGLIPSSSGNVVSGGRQLNGANPDVAMVFQNFALLPWLTVLENVELGLEARGVNKDERRKRAIKAIDMVGLDGFESAYPKELSGGMKQRVGFARAFVIEPEVLFMDEPFSALDVLTAENLRNEVVNLWLAGEFPAKSVLIVTHNIEEAVFLCDRILVLGTNPGHIRGEITIDLPRPRDRDNQQFKALVDNLYTVMTNPAMEVTGTPAAAIHLSRPPSDSPYAQPLPHARAGGISGFLEILVNRSHSLSESESKAEDIYELARRLRLATDDLLPILDAAVLLGFARVEHGDVSLTDTGREFAQADIQHSKELFRRQLLHHAPLVGAIHRTLDASGNISADFFIDILDEHYPNAEAERQFATAVDWGRYAELFEYNLQQNKLTITTD